MRKEKNPTTVKIRDPKVSEKLSEIKKETGVPIERTVNDILEKELINKGEKK